MQFDSVACSVSPDTHRAHDQARRCRQVWTTALELAEDDVSANFDASEPDDTSLTMKQVIAWTMDADKNTEPVQLKKTQTTSL